MDIAHLLIGLNIKVAQLLARGGLQGLLEVRAQAAPAIGCLSGDLIVVIDALGALGGIVLLIEVGERGREAVRDTVLLVQRDRLHDGIVAHYVPVRQVLCDDARSGLVFLRDVLLFPGLGLRVGDMGSAYFFDVVGCFNVNGRSAQLGLV